MKSPCSRSARAATLRGRKSWPRQSPYHSCTAASGGMEVPIFKHFLGTTGQPLVLRVALFRPRESHQFDLLKLVLADDAAHVAAVAAGFAAETGRVGGQPDGQPFAV